MQLSEQEFLKDVADHTMKVLRDDGVYRHLRFSAPDTHFESFELITWPGHVCYTGDMGTFVFSLFSQKSDPFDYFRMKLESATATGEQKLVIKPASWASKLQSVDKCCNHEEFDEEAFKKVISEYRLKWIRSGKLNKYEREELWNEIKYEVLLHANKGPQIAPYLAYSFSHRIGKVDYQFEDIYEHNFNRPTRSFLWCCYALVWGIALYDNSHSE